MKAKTEEATCDLSVVIPAFRSAANLPELYDRLVVVLTRMEVSWELVFIDDASDDETWAALCGLQAKDAGRVTIVQLMENVGQHAALLCGFGLSSGRFVLTMDDDLQHPPEEIPRLWQVAIAGDAPDVVYGVYSTRRQNPLRQLAAAAVYLVYLLRFRLRARPSPFRLLRASLVRSMLAARTRSPMIDELIALHTKRTVATTVEHHWRRHGRSTYSMLKLLRLALGVLESDTGVSTRRMPPGPRT